MRWKAQEAMTSCGGLRSGTGFIAYGQQKGVALGFWGLGFTFSLPPLMGVYGLIGYALFATVTAEEIEYYPPNSPPVISQINPYDGEINVPLSLSELRFQIFDYDGDLMSYTVTTTPDIGSGSGNLKPDGVYSVPISGLEDLTEYSWHIEVTDGMDTTVDDFIFTTEAIAPIVSNPSPQDEETYVSIDLSQLSFHLKDFQGDPMDYTVETSPNIGSDSGNGVNEGTYSVDVNNLDNNTVYTWYVNVTDGEHWTRKQFAFETVYPTFFDPFEFGWQYRKEITISPDNIDSDLSNFPVLISITDNDLEDKAQSDGDDILFMDNRNIAIKLSHQMEQFDSNSGALIAWVNLTNINAFDETNFYLYYGNSNCLNKENIGGTWDSYYVSIWHMDDLTPLKVGDSINGGHDGIKRENYKPVESDGKIFKAQQFDGSNDYIRISNLASYNQYSQGTIEMWFKWRPGGNYPGGLFGYSGDSNQGDNDYINMNLGEWGSEFPDESIAYQFKNSGIIQYFGWYRGGHELYHDGIWHYMTLVVGNDYNKLYVDGEELYLEYNYGDGSVGNYFLNIDDVDFFYLGAADVSGRLRYFFNCDLDETRISMIPRSAAWISASYNNQNDPSSFMSIGPEEPAP